jgi:hypothetical protein
MTLIPIAVELNELVPIHKDAKECEAQGISERDYLRVRLNVHWMVECTHV